MLRKLKKLGCTDDNNRAVMCMRHGIVLSAMCSGTQVPTFRSNPPPPCLGERCKSSRHLDWQFPVDLTHLRLVRIYAPDDGFMSTHKTNVWLALACGCGRPRRWKHYVPSKPGATCSKRRAVTSRRLSSAERTRLAEGMACG
jgi:hypothetical protein